jgi:cytochrome c oxidase subunit 3
VSASTEAAVTTSREEAQNAARGESDLGMWVFLTSETLFFGALFFGYLVMRLRYPDAFAAAGRHTDLVLGTLNTGVLLTSSLLMALAVGAADKKRRRPTCLLLLATAGLGAAFLVIKGLEYHAEYLEHLVPALDFRFDAAHRRGAELFFWLYFVMTGFHALHLAIGVALLGFVALRLWRRGFAAQTPTSVAMSGLYWHFVDVVWIFMYPCLYLIARS